MPKIYAGGKIPGSKFNQPRHKVVRDNGKQRNAVHLFKYWKHLEDLPDDTVELAEVRIYRLWPVVDMRAVEPDRKTIEWALLFGKIPFDPEEYEDWFLDSYGSGEYKCILNEKGVAGEIMTGYFRVYDLDAHPPKLDYRMLVKGNSSNQDYIRWLRNRNIPIPGEDPEGEEREAMNVASNEALKVVTDAAIKMADKNTEMAEKVAEARIDAIQKDHAASSPSLADQAGAQAIEMIGDAARNVVKMVSENAGTQYNPVEIMRTAAELMAGVGRPQDTTAEVLRVVTENMEKSNERIFRMQQESIQNLREDLRAQRSPVMETAVARVAPEEQLDALLDRSFKIAERFGYSKKNGGGGDAEPRESGSGFKQTLADNIGPIMTGITTIVALGANMFHNWAAARNNGQQPIPPATVLQAQQAQQPNPMQNPDTGVQTQQPQATLDPVMQKWGRFMQEFSAPFWNHFTGTDSDGYTLAYFLQTDGTGGQITPEGRRKYLVIREQLGIEKMDYVIKNTFDLWSKVQSMPGKYKEFLTQFFSYDEMMAAREDEGEKGAAA